TTLLLIRTRPSAIIASAARRDATPASASSLFNRVPSSADVRGVEAPPGVLARGVRAGRSPAGRERVPSDRGDDPLLPPERGGAFLPPDAREAPPVVPSERVDFRGRLSSEPPRAGRSARPDPSAGPVGRRLSRPPPCVDRC